MHVQIYVLISSALDGFNQLLFENLPPAVRTRRGLFQNLIRHARIGAGNAVENIVERNLGTLGIALLQNSISFSDSRKVAASTRMTFCASGVGSKKSRGIAKGF